jgi:hypothetical protein
VKKNQNLKIIIAVEIVLVLCLCLGVAGIFIYANGPQVIPASGNPPAEIPTATAIFANVPTAETVATEALAMTPTREVKGMALEKLPEKTTRFTDYDGGYEILFPAGWLAVRPADEEFNTVLATEGAKNAMLADQMNTDKSVYDANRHRVFSYPLRPDIKKSAIFGFSKIALETDEAPIDNNSMGVWVRSFEASNTAPGLRVTATNIEKNGNGISFMVVKGRFSLKTEGGDLIPFSITSFFFKPTPGSLVSVTITILQDYQEQLSPDLDAIQESIKFLEQ